MRAGTLVKLRDSAMLSAGWEPTERYGIVLGTSESVFKGDQDEMAMWKIFMRMISS